ncbi:hypothetical protein HY469_03110 [Candidatus Roizmanbacteria bacterium]|nr:hypothetical protein [Candidatus Roizmanbacteria bacterium]
MKKTGLAIGIMAALIALFFYNGVSSKSSNPQESDNHAEEIHYHAGFIVYEQDTPVDFTDLKYMHVEPCGVEEEHEEDEQEEKAHLHDGIGNVVHVHRNDAYWRDLFTNIQYELKEPVTGYIDGLPVEHILDQRIEPYQSIVIFSGENQQENENSTNVVTREQIEAAEKNTESC